jgi:hypothetical protein
MSVKDWTILKKKRLVYCFFQYWNLLRWLGSTKL